MENKNEIMLFKLDEFGEVRTLVIEGESWFVGKDVAEILGYAKARNAIAKHVDREDKKDAPIQGVLGGTQSMTIINESVLPIIVRTPFTIIRFNNAFSFQVLFVHITSYVLHTSEHLSIFLFSQRPLKFFFLIPSTSCSRNILQIPKNISPK